MKFKIMVRFRDSVRFRVRVKVKEIILVRVRVRVKDRVRDVLVFRVRVWFPLLIQCRSTGDDLSTLNNNM